MRTRFRSGRVSPCRPRPIYTTTQNVSPPVIKKKPLIILLVGRQVTELEATFGKDADLREDPHREDGDAGGREQRHRRQRQGQDPGQGRYETRSGCVACVFSLRATFPLRPRAARPPVGERRCFFCMYIETFCRVPYRPGRSLKGASFSLPVGGLSNYMRVYVPKQARREKSLPAFV